METSSFSKILLIVISLIVISAIGAMLFFSDFNRPTPPEENVETDIEQTVSEEQFKRQITGSVVAVDEVNFTVTIQDDMERTVLVEIEPETVVIETIESPSSSVFNEVNIADLVEGTQVIVAFTDFGVLTGITETIKNVERIDFKTTTDDNYESYLSTYKTPVPLIGGTLSALDTSAGTAEITIRILNSGEEKQFLLEGITASTTIYSILDEKRVRIVHTYSPLSLGDLRIGDMVYASVQEQESGSEVIIPDTLFVKSSYATQ